MKNFFKSDSLSLGLAIFSMFFGAGNIIFPLAVGEYAGDKNSVAILGLILTAAVMPIVGVIAMILYEGSYKNFFGRLGKIPGLILALIIISLLGPLGSTPRCIALAYTTLKSSFLDISPTLFSAFACLLIFLFSFRRTHLLTLLGWVLTPLLLLSLTAIIFLGFLAPADIQSVDQNKLRVFLHGLKEGYNTMDLLAAFFFSSTILNVLRLRSAHKENGSVSSLSIAFRASLIGAILLAVVYTGFSYLASFHGSHLAAHEKDELLSMIIMKISGNSFAGLLVCTTIALACLTTAIALISAFSDFIQKEIFREKISYEWILTGSLIATFFVATFEFRGISAFLGPILQVCYPGLIVLTILNIAFRLKNFKPIKIPVFFVFALSLTFYLVKEGVL